MSESRTRHPDAAQLLAWIDGELPFWHSWRVRRHVDRCWMCRARTSDFEEAIRVVGQRLQPADVSPVDRARARWAFRSGVAEFEANLRRRKGLQPLKLAAAASALVVIGIAAFGLRTTPVATNTTPGAMLAAAVSAETPPVRSAVREERFTVEYRSGSEPLTRRELRVLLAPGHNAWTARWSAGNGELHNAVFASDSREFARPSGLQPAVFTRATSYESLFARVHAGNADIEQMILDWIRHQVWQPVSLAREVSEFCTRTGAVLRVAKDGRAVLWAAAATAEGVQFEIHLESMQPDPPAVLSLHWRSGRSSGAVRIRREERREYDDLRLAAARLYPPSPQSRLAKTAPLTISADTPALPPRLSIRELLAAEVAVMRRLHRAGLCRNDAIRVARTIAGVEVSGTFADEDQAAGIAGLMSDIPHVRLRLSTLDALPAVSQQTLAPAEPQSRPAAAEPWLRARFGVGVRFSEREMFNVMSSVVSDAEEVLAASWALLHLSRRFPAQLENEMDAETKSALREIADEHLVSMSVHLAGIDGRLALPESENATEMDIEAWQEGSLVLHEEARKTSELLLSWFAGGDAVRTQMPVDPDQPELRALIGRVRSLATSVRGRLEKETWSGRQ